MKQNEELAKSVLNAIDDDVLNAAEMEMTEGGRDINALSKCPNTNCGDANCGNCVANCGGNSDDNSAPED